MNVQRNVDGATQTANAVATGMTTTPSQQQQQQQNSNSVGAPIAAGSAGAAAQTMVPVLLPELSFDQIQMLLDDTQRCLLAVMQAQNSGNAQAALQYQTQVHRNLQKLAAQSDRQQILKRQQQAQNVYAKAAIASESGAAGSAQGAAVAGSSLKKGLGVASTSGVSKGSGSQGTSNRQGLDKRRWTPEEHQKFDEAVQKFYTPEKPNVALIAEYMGTRTNVQVRKHLQRYLAKKLREKEKRENEKNETEG
mmetsp:Transcript_5100/g.8904  ORF Transcript_5100/g.8904 Transcript_5100/m.8904 type:complete len:250 (-) Transcript_5100:1223-1972(-)